MVGLAFCPKILRMWQEPKNSVCHFVNVDGEFVLLGGAWETSILHAVIKLISASVYSQQW